MRSGLLKNCKAIFKVHSRRQHLPTAGRLQRHAGTSADLVSNGITLGVQPRFQCGCLASRGTGVQLRGQALMGRRPTALFISTYDSAPPLGLCR